ncbi:MAG: hypothetical protein SVE93_06570 [Candidatus Thermoplasmatota archaeon]|nr:hypothetical protein [Candidatus Thermoplasmatota archaeon]
MKQNRLITLILSVAIAIPAMSIIALAQQEGLRIETPSSVISGERFKIVVTYNGKPAGYAYVTFEGAVVEPTRTNDNGVATITAPNVTKPTNVIIYVKDSDSWSEQFSDYVTITVLPTKEVREEEMIETSTTLFKGEIKIAGHSYWASRYDVSYIEPLIISIKTDGNTINEFVLDGNSYSRYLENKTIYAKDYYQYNVMEGVYIVEVPRGGEWHVVLENPHENAVSVSVDISKTRMT